MNFNCNAVIPVIRYYQLSQLLSFMKRIWVRTEQTVNLTLVFTYLLQKVKQKIP